MPLYRVEMYVPHYETGGLLEINQDENQVVVHDPGQFPELAHAFTQDQHGIEPTNLAEWLYRRALQAAIIPNRRQLLAGLPDFEQDLIQDLEELRDREGAVAERARALVSNEILVSLGGLMLRNGFEPDLRDFTADRLSDYEQNPHLEPLADIAPRQSVRRHKHVT